jgi:hypothetical protein
MKIILSRKGFDSTYGNIPSPVVKTREGNYKVVSLPIPSTQEKSDIKFSDLSLIETFSMRDFILANHKTFSKRFSEFCHLDPDISFDTKPAREYNWHPAFGQDDTAQSVLYNNQVDSGDIFLFFGWFQFAEFINNTYKFIKNNEYPNGFHMLFGYLKIEKSFTVKEFCPDELKYHPHFKFHNNYRDRSQRNNTIYKATRYLDRKAKLKGSNSFNFSRDLILTKPYENRRTIWKLPDFFSMENGVVMTYHTKPERWSKENNHTILMTVSKGQEFVILNDPNEKVASWSLDIIRRHSK